jgi:hypothetical protein
MASKVIIGALAFAAGGVAGALFVRWYIQTHPASTIGGAAIDKIFGEDSPTGTTLKGLLPGLDRAAA